MESILSCPIVSVNARVWRFWSFVLKHDAMRYISIIPVTVMTFFMFLDLGHSWGDFQDVIIKGYFAVLYFNAVLRTLILVKDRKLYENFMEGISKFYFDISRIDDHQIQSLLRSYTARARMLSISNLALGAIISTCFTVYPMFTGVRGLPYGMYIPGVDGYQSPQYEIIYLVQVVLTFPGCCMYIPFTSFFVSTTLFGLVQIKTLQRQLQTFKDGIGSHGNKNANLQVIKLIQDHKRIIAYVSELNSLVTYICFVEFLSFGLMLCALLFLLNVIENHAQIVIVAAYIFMIISQIFAFYWHANEVREESMNIAEAAYSGPWVELDDSIKKKLLLIILRAQQPLEITVGNVYPMTLEMFQSLLNASYSYFTLLRRVYN